MGKLTTHPGDFTNVVLCSTSPTYAKIKTIPRGGKNSYSEGCYLVVGPDCLKPSEVLGVSVHNVTLLLAPQRKLTNSILQIVKSNKTFTTITVNFKCPHTDLKTSNKQKTGKPSSWFGPVSHITANHTTKPETAVWPLPI